MKSATVLALALVSSISAQDSCWEKCFVSPPDMYKHEYTHLHHLVQLVRGAAITYNTYGTAILLDSSVNNPTEWSYEKMLARLVVLTSSVGQSSNPFFMAQYAKNSWSNDDWDCQNTCQASNTINLLWSLQGNQAATDTVYMACTHADYNMDPSRQFPYNKECTKNITNNRIAVAFMNSNADNYTHFFCNNFDVRIAVRILPTASKAWNLTPAFQRPLGPAMDFETSYTGLNGVPSNTVNALTGLLSCMEERCCSASTNLYFDARSVKEESFLVSTKGSQGVKLVDKTGLQAALNKAAKA